MFCQGQFTLLHSNESATSAFRAIKSHNVSFSPQHKMKAFLPSSSSLASSSSALLSLSCNITCLAMEAKVRFLGVVEEVEGDVMGWWRILEDTGRKCVGGLEEISLHVGLKDTVGDKGSELSTGEESGLDMV